VSGRGRALTPPSGGKNFSTTSQVVVKVHVSSLLPAVMSENSHCFAYENYSENSDSPRPAPLSENSDGIVVSRAGDLEFAGNFLHAHAEREQAADAEGVRRDGLVKQEFAHQFKVSASLRPGRGPRVAGDRLGDLPADRLVGTVAVAVPDGPTALGLNGQRRPVVPVLADRAWRTTAARFRPPVQAWQPVDGDAVSSEFASDALPGHSSNALLARRVTARSGWDNEHAP
jgi:hypothetical protein